MVRAPELIPHASVDWPHTLTLRAITHEPWHQPLPHIHVLSPSGCWPAITEAVCASLCLTTSHTYLDSGNGTGASISGGLINTAAAVAAVPLKPNIESVGAFSSDFGEILQKPCE